MITHREKIRKLYKAAWHKLAVRNINSTPVFIFGEMRSGTNMLTDCLDRSWRTATYNESDNDAFKGYTLLDNDVVAGLIQRSRATHVVFKSLADSARAVELLEFFPAARAVWIFRNYQDVVNSAMRKWTEHNQYLSYILHDPEKGGWRARHLPKSLVELVREHYDRGISDTSARALIWYIRNSLFFQQKLESKKRVRLIRYEGLARCPEAEFERIFEFLELPLQHSYFRRVSTKSIRRDAAPAIDEAIMEICDALQERLIKQLEPS